MTRPVFRYAVWGVAVLLIAVAGGWLLMSRQDDGPTPPASADIPALRADISGFARAILPYEWEFPRDHGAHPAFQTEWWYYTGNLAIDSGQRFGFQFTLFRRAIVPETPDTGSEWRTNQVYMAHFTITDVDQVRFYQAQRFSRDSAGLAGAMTDPVFRIWLEDWEIQALDSTATRTRLNTAAGGMAVQLELEQVKPMVFQGENGLSPKDVEPGRATYYYSLPRLAARGTLVINGETYPVSGTAWMDHEFGTAALGVDAQGWDWFALHLDDNRDLMLGYIRLVDGSPGPVYGGSFTLPDGSTRHIGIGESSVRVTATWTSPHSKATYPAGWEIDVDIGEAEPLHLILTPLIADQELTEGIVYWEGAIRVTGDVSGYGYAELTGYHTPMRDRF